MRAVFFWHQVCPQLMELLLTFLPFRHCCLHLCEGFFFLFSPLPSRLVRLYEICSFIHSLSQLTFIEHIHVPDITKHWVYDCDRVDKPLPSRGTAENKVWIVRSVTRGGGNTKACC